MLFQLQLFKHGLEGARKLDRIIRAKMKEILHLLTWTSTDWIHSKEDLELMELQSNARIARKRQARKCYCQVAKSHKQ